MSNVQRFVATVGYYAIGASLAFLILYAGSQVVVYAPELEGWAWPVVKFVAVSDVSRIPHDATYTTGRVCFTLRIHKVSVGSPLPYRFVVNTPYSTRIPVAVLLANKDDTRAANQSYGPPHPVGETWDRRYCFELPGTISDADTVTVNGYSVHVRHALWTTETHMPPFTVPPAVPVKE